jgi:2-keto-4-pentenoate hydratase/2-oxohepta-3-ene-1,7-dioic acid hydratase in catechol pathway
MPGDKPNSEIASGITAEAGSGRMNPSIGCSQLRAAAELPMSAPSVMPSSEASDQPTSMRFTVAKVQAARSPSASPSARLANAAPGVGRSTLLTRCWWLASQSAGQALRLSRTSSRHGAWSLAQMLTHHTEGGCNMNPGDLIGTGTQTGPTDAEKGCLLELSFGGKQPITLPNGETRAMLEDGDTVVPACAG